MSHDDEWAVEDVNRFMERPDVQQSLEMLKGLDEQLDQIEALEAERDELRRSLDVMKGDAERRREAWRTQSQTLAEVLTERDQLRAELASEREARREFMSASTHLGNVVEDLREVIVQVPGLWTAAQYEGGEVRLPADLFVGFVNTATGLLGRT